MQKVFAIDLLLVVLVFGDNYRVPEPTLEAFAPKGLKISIPDVSGIRFVAFHLRKDRDFQGPEEGEIVGEVTEPLDGFWFYRNDDVRLKIGDIVRCWLFVQVNDQGYQKEGIQYKIENLGVDMDVRVVPDGSVGFGKEILVDKFDGSSVNGDFWIVDKMIPAKSKTNEFVSYEPNNDVVYTSNGKLYIKPKLRENVTGTLDLKKGCTGIDDECYFTHYYYNILPPIISGRIRTKKSFRFGRIEIIAKLPEGDWIFPSLKLQTADENDEQILIAFSRGNAHLTGNNGDDIGASILFGGIIEDSNEPKRSKLLRSIRVPKGANKAAHNFTTVWNQGGFYFYFDGSNFGTVLLSDLENPAAFNRDFHLVIGVGVGGVNVFPDGYMSGNHVKPWEDTNPKRKRQFHKAISEWLPTWSGDKIALQVDSVKIWISGIKGFSLPVISTSCFTSSTTTS